MTGALHHLSAVYALDALDTAERDEFEAHYPTCEICVADVALDREVAARLAEAVAIAPPEWVRSAVLTGVAQTRQLPPIVRPRAGGSPRRWTRPGMRVSLAAVAAAILVVVGGVAVAIRSASGIDVDDVVAAPDASITELDGGDGSVRVAWSPELDHVAVLGSDLGDPGPGLAYALWFVDTDGSVAPAGLFTPDDDGMVRLVIGVDDRATAGWGVTIEPATGSDQPTTPIIFSGEI